MVLNRLRIILILLALDIIFTAITFGVTGTLDWEVNPLVGPGHLIILLVINQILWIWASISNMAGFMCAIYLRVIAVLSHVITWICMLCGLSITEQIQMANAAGYRNQSPHTAFIVSSLISIAFILWNPLNLTVQMRKLKHVLKRKF